MAGETYDRAADDRAADPGDTGVEYEYGGGTDEAERAGGPEG
jgi:hypothetical protein